MMRKRDDQGVDANCVDISLKSPSPQSFYGDQKIGRQDLAKYSVFHDYDRYTR